MSLLICIIIVLWFVYVRHQGDWDKAKKEIMEVLSSFGHAISPFLPRVKSSLYIYRWQILVAIVITIFVVVQYGIPAMGPKTVSLHGGENTLQDLCGNPVTIWVLTEHVDPNNRLEVTPAEIGQEIEIKKPGTPARCGWTLPLNLEKSK